MSNVFPTRFSAPVYPVFFLYNGYEPTDNRIAVKYITQFFSAEYVRSRHSFHCAYFFIKIMIDNVMRIFSFFPVASFFETLLIDQANFNVW